MVDINAFQPSTECSGCSRLIELDDESPTGAVATIPCELWTNGVGRGFEMHVRNYGSCEVHIFLRSEGENRFRRASGPATMMNTEGKIVMRADGSGPATAIPFQSDYQIRTRDRSDGECFENKIIVEESRRVCAIGILCVRQAGLCPDCDIDICLTLSCGQSRLYRVSALADIERESNGGSNRREHTITGIVQCPPVPGTTDGTEIGTLDPTNLLAELICCPRIRGEDETLTDRILDTVAVTPSITDPTMGTYVFRQAVSCFRVRIICGPDGKVVGTGTSTGTGRSRVLGSSECQLVEEGSGGGGNSTRGRPIAVEPIVIDCAACVDLTVRFGGTAVCTSSSTGVISNVSVQFIRCVTNETVDPGTGRERLTCGAPLANAVVLQLPIPANGIFLTTPIPQDCYLVQFVCTTTGVVLAKLNGGLCKSYRRLADNTLVNLGTAISVPCTCNLTTFAVSGLVVCNSGSTSTIGSAASGGITASLIGCTTATVKGTTLIATATVTALGAYNFPAVPAGNYFINFSCASCAGTTPVIATTNCFAVTTADVINATTTIPCDNCNTFTVLGTVTCTTGSAANISIGINFFNPIDGITPIGTEYRQTDVNGNYSFCIPSGSVISLDVVRTCSGTIQILGPLLTKTTVTASISASTTIGCLCPVVTTSSFSEAKVIGHLSTKSTTSSKRPRLAGAPAMDEHSDPANSIGHAKTNATHSGIVLSGIISPAPGNGTCLVVVTDTSTSSTAAVPVTSAGGYSVVTGYSDKSKSGQSGSRSKSVKVVNGQWSLELPPATYRVMISQFFRGSKVEVLSIEPARKYETDYNFTLNL